MSVLKSGEFQLINPAEAIKQTHTPLKVAYTEPAYVLESYYPNDSLINVTNVDSFVQSRNIPHNVQSQLYPNAPTLKADHLHRLNKNVAPLILVMPQDGQSPFVDQCQSLQQQLLILEEEKEKRKGEGEGEGKAKAKGKGKQSGSLFMTQRITLQTVRDLRQKVNNLTLLVEAERIKADAERIKADARWSELQKQFSDLTIGRNKPYFEYSWIAHVLTASMG